MKENKEWVAPLAVFIFLVILIAGVALYNASLTVTQVTNAVIVDKYHDSGDCYAVGDNYSCDAPEWGLVLKTSEGRLFTQNVKRKFWENTPVTTPVTYCVTRGRLNMVTERRVCR